MVRVPLGEMVRLRRGFDLPAHARRAGAVPVVSSCGIAGMHDTSRVPAPGVVTGRTGTLGQVFLVEEDFWPLNTTLFVEEFRGHDPSFIAHLLRSLDVRSRNENAAVPGISRASLESLDVPCPPLRDQRAIAGKLDVLDRRVRVLRKMERTLAEMAVETYRLVPRGRARPVRDLCASFGNGATPPRARAELWRDGTVPWFRSGELADGPLVEPRERIAARALDETPCRPWPAGTVLIAIYAAPTVGRLGVLMEPAAFNQACTGLVARAEVGHWFLFHALLATRLHLERLASGSAQQNIRQSLVLDHRVPVPSRTIARAFHERVEHLHALRAAHDREATHLERWRDALTRQLLRARSLGSPQRRRDAEAEIEGG